MLVPRLPCPPLASRDGPAHLRHYARRALVGNPPRCRLQAWFAAQMRAPSIRCVAPACPGRPLSRDERAHACPPPGEQHAAKSVRARPALALDKRRLTFMMNEDCRNTRTRGVSDARLGAGSGGEALTPTHRKTTPTSRTVPRRYCDCRSVAVCLRLPTTGPSVIARRVRRTEWRGNSVSCPRTKRRD